MNIGQNIQKIIKEKNITHAELAKRMGVSRPLISTLIKSNSVTTDTLFKLSAALDVPIFKFFDRKDLFGTENEVMALLTEQQVNSIREIQCLIGIALGSFNEKNYDKANVAILRTFISLSSFFGIKIYEQDEIIPDTVKNEMKNFAEMEKKLENEILTSLRIQNLYWQNKNDENSK